MGRYKDLLVYKKAFEQAMNIFQASKKFPREERFSLTDQIRRSSRAVCSNIAEAYMKRKYPAYFINKFTDVDAENEETSVWLDFSFDCQYLTPDDHNRLLTLNREVGKLIGDILKSPQKYL